MNGFCSSSALLFYRLICFFLISSAAAEILNSNNTQVKTTGKQSPVFIASFGVLSTAESGVPTLDVASGIAAAAVDSTVV